MKRIRPLLLGLFFALAGIAVAAAQDAHATPPKVIQISARISSRAKPARCTTDRKRHLCRHDRAKLQGHYVALNSIAGSPRTLPLPISVVGSLEKDNQILEKNPSFAAEMDRADYVRTATCWTHGHRPSRVQRRTELPSPSRSFARTLLRDHLVSREARPYRRFHATRRRCTRTRWKRWSRAHTGPCTSWPMGERRTNTSC